MYYHPPVSLTGKVRILDGICKLNRFKAMMLEQFIQVGPFHLLLLRNQHTIKTEGRVKNSTEQTALTWNREQVHRHTKVLSPGCEH